MQMNDKAVKKAKEWRDDSIHGLRAAIDKKHGRHKVIYAVSELGKVMIGYAPQAAMPLYRLDWLKPGQDALINTLQTMPDPDLKNFVVATLRNTVQSENVLKSLPQEHIVPYLKPARDAFIEAALNNDIEPYTLVSHTLANHTAFGALQETALSHDVLHFVPERQRMTYVMPAFDAYIRTMDRIDMQSDPAVFSEAMNVAYTGVKASLSKNEYSTFVKSSLKNVSTLAETGNEQNRPVWKQIRSELAGNNEIIPYLSKEELEQAGYLNFAGKNGKELEKQTEVLLTFLETHQDMAQAFVEPLYNRDYEIVMDFHHETKLYININDDKTWEKMENLRNDHKLLVKTQKDPRLNNNQLA